MVPLTLKEVAEACGGRLDGADPDALVTSVVADSRAAAPGALFVALAGERTDGHAHVSDAFTRGATASLVVEGREVAPGPLVRCADPLAGLAHVAAYGRGRLRARTIAITGSSGKTCTKDLTAAAVATTRRVAATPGNFNAEIGVPLTVLSADDDTEVLVVEVGSRGIGHIAALVAVVRPDVAVVTNVGLAHVGMFGGIRSTARAKAELVEALGPDGAAVLNADDPPVAAMAAVVRGRVLTFGMGPDADVRAHRVSLDERARATFTIEAPGEETRVSLRTPGEHMIPNALAAAAAAIAVGVPLERAGRGIAACDAPAWRMQLVDAPRGVLVINDAYNANPDSVAAALRSLVILARGRSAWAVLGHMAELGAEAEAEHDRIGRLVAQLGIYHLVTIGDEARTLHAAARSEGLRPEEAVFAPTAGDALAYLRDTLEPGAVVLVKASRAAGLERVVDGLVEGGA